MDHMKTPEEPNGSEKPGAWPFLEEWTEAWKQLEERVRLRPRQHLLMAFVIGYLLQIIPKRLLATLLRWAAQLCYTFRSIRTANLARTRWDEKDGPACQSLGALAAGLYSAIQRRYQ